MNRIVAFLSSFAIVLCTNAATWFDAGIKDYTDWPTDGSDKIVLGVGVWTGTSLAELVRADGVSHLNFSTESFEEELAFGLADTAKAISANPVIKSKIMFSASDDLDPVDAGSKAALTVIDSGNGQFVYYGLVADDERRANRWAALSGAVPVCDEVVELEVSFKTENGGVFVRYVVGGACLKLNGAEWLPIIVPEVDGRLSGVYYSGSGSIFSLSAETAEIAEYVTLSVPAFDRMTVESVIVNGAEVAAGPDGTYMIQKGASVVVKFRPAAGSYIDKTSMVFTMTQDMVLPEDGRPVEVPVSTFISVSEVMASNGETLGTKNGGAELDWIEIRNSSDFDIDLAGWYVGDDLTKNPSKWTRIEGSCVVPAKGFKIVWCDKTYADWAPEEAYSKFGIGKGGGTMFLADAPSVDAVRVTAEYPAQMKDVSYGLGRREKTLFDAFAPAQYRVGDGAWRDVSGPVGMPGATNGFTVTMYKLADATTVNALASATAVETGKYSQKVVNTGVQTIAFTGNGGSVSDEFQYAAMSSLGAPDKYFALVVEGVIDIPRAGDWTFTVGSDDGFMLDVFNSKYSFSSEYTGTRSYGQTPAILKIQEPGAYNVRLVYSQRSGGATLDFSVKEGAFESYENFSLADFRLVGSAGSGVTHAGEWAGYAFNDVSGEMLGVSGTLGWKTRFDIAEEIADDDICRLKIRCADGFTASVNGSVVTNVPAAGPRSLVEALEPFVIDIPTSCFSAGENTIEITAENDVVDSAEFLLSAEASVTKAAETLVYFREPTPGAANTTPGYGPSTPKVVFSEPHGWKTAPISVELSCPDAPGARIYYTLDGTSPTASSTPYTGPIPVSSTTCIRAAIPQEGSVVQLDSSATYLYLDDVLAQTRGEVPYGFPNATINNQKMMYGMDQSVVNGEDRERLLRGFTNSVATLSIVIDPANLFDPVSGIYVNAIACDGRPWERLTMVEQIDPRDPSNGFSTAAGIRIRGAFSRKPEYPKHSLRLFFRNDYGDGPLEFPLFGDEGAGEFKKVDLRTSQNWSWANGYENDTFVHEVFSRDAQGAMGELYTKSRYYNLFINGHYWGVYQTQERGDDDFGETYNGGDSDNYDVIKTSQPGYVTGASEGNIDAWEALWKIAVHEGFAGEHSANYARAMGLNPDGTRNPEYPVYLNPTNLMDYVLCSHYTVDYDAPAAPAMVNNLYAVRNRFDDDDGLKQPGFYFLRHDAEHSLGIANGSNAKYSTDPTLRGTEEAHSIFTKLEGFNPAQLHYRLCANPEYRMAFADRFHKHCLASGGALTAEKNRERFMRRMAEIDDVVVCEAARWATKGQTRQTWLDSCNTCFTFFEKRTPYMLQQYRNRGWYPSIDVPKAVAPDGSELVDGATLPASSSAYLHAPSGGKIYYTTDGSDPRLAGGAVNPAALEFTDTAPRHVTNTVSVFSTGASWSCYDWGREPLADGAGRAWNAEGYDPSTAAGDHSWITGSGVIGFSSDISVGTKLSRYENHASSGTQVMTFYFRKTFEISDAAAAEAISSVSGSVMYDDGFVMYINGVEVGRGNIPAGYEVEYGTGTNETGTDYITTASRSTYSFKVPEGVLHAGENVIAVELHQCHGTSSDAIWDASLDCNSISLVEGTGGIRVPADGLGVKARVLMENGEWSALTDVFVKSDLPQSDVKDGLRLAEALTAALDGDDTLDYLIFTNAAPGEICLDGMKIVAWNAKKKSEDDPSLTYVFPAGTSMRPGETLRLANLDKLTNSQVGLRIYGADGKLVQDVFLDVDWWNGVCDEMGAYFIARTFGPEAKTHADWKPSATDLGEKLRVCEIYTSTADGDGDGAEFVVLTNLDASAGLDLTDVKIVAWNAKKKSEDDPSLVLALDGVDIPAGGTLRLDKATYFASDKLTNSKVGLKIYDPAGACAQEIEVDADWWSKACDGTGANFVATTFGKVAKAQSDWRPSFLPASDSAGAAAITAAIAGDDRIRGWINSLYATAEGQSAIASFTGTSAWLAKCYLVNVLPDCEEIDLKIRTFSVGPDGSVTVQGGLDVDGAPLAPVVNGNVRLYYAGSLEGLDSSVDYVSLGQDILQTQQKKNVAPPADGGSIFFRLKIE